MTIKDLKPTEIWSYFYDITQIPRPSKKEEKILAYLLDFAKKHNLKSKQDKAGNILITKEATSGKENTRPPASTRQSTPISTTSTTS